MPQLKKISELPVADELNDGSCYPIVQDGITKKIPFLTMWNILKNKFFSDVNKYSYDEKIIGKWVDDKDIVRKKITATGSEKNIHEETNFSYFALNDNSYRSDTIILDAKLIISQGNKKNCVATPFYSFCPNGYPFFVVDKTVFSGSTLESVILTYIKE